MRIVVKIAVTFVIGLFAGVCPFLFLQLLPALLHPTQTIVTPNYTAIGVTGVLVGAISAIVFAKTFETRDPSDIFFYALGVPALLVATVSNVGTKFDAARAIDAAQAQASNAVLQTLPPAVNDINLKPVAPPEPARSSGMPPVGVAWAGEIPLSTMLPMVAQAVDQYLVVIGQYTTATEAWTTVKQLQDRRLKTELYVPKSLRVLQGGGQSYYVAYTGPLSRQDADKLYRLIQINDPDLSPQLVRSTK
jgi:hypothetical protein